MRELLGAHVTTVQLFFVMITLVVCQLVGVSKTALADVTGEWSSAGVSSHVLF